MSVVGAFALKQVMYVLECEIRCSGNTAFLIALVGASLQ